MEGQAATADDGVGRWVLRGVAVIVVQTVRPVSLHGATL